MAINYMEIQPNEHAVKDIRGWVDSRTGEVLVAAYGYFTGDALKQQGQGVVFTAYDGKFDPLYLKAPSNFRSLKFGNVTVGEGLKAEVSLEDIDTEQYSITLGLPKTRMSLPLSVAKSGLKALIKLMLKKPCCLL
jgi:hypothetical protein